MRTVIMIIINLFCCYSCRSNESDNAKLIREIDNIKVIDTTYELQVDSNGRVIDTISMRRHKRGKKGNEVFREITSFENNRRIVVKNYYRENAELFYSVTETPEGIFSLYENWEKDGKVQEAIIVDYRKEGPDTLKMKFSYELSRDGKLKKLTINDSGGTSIAETYYNENEKPYLEYQFFDSDTLSETKYEYEGEKLKSERTFDKRKKTEIVRYYGDEKLVSAIEEYVNDSLVSKQVFSRDSQGNILAKVIK